jgi:hypothetical protein
MITLESTLVVLTEAPLTFLDEVRCGGGGRGGQKEEGCDTKVQDVAPLLFGNRTVSTRRIKYVHLAKPLDPE